MDVSLPLTANTETILGVFFVSLVVFDLWLVRWWKLGRVAWKRVDYVWLAAAAFGLFGASSEVRRLVAPNFVSFARLRQQAQYEDLQREVRFLSNSAICRVFNKSSFSPTDVEDAQRQFDAVCEFGKTAASALPPDAPSERLDLAPLRTRPPVQDAMLLDEYRALDRAISRYVESESNAAALFAASERSSFELTLVIVSPLLLAVALALRITKVTGELHLSG